MLKNHFGGKDTIKALLQNYRAYEIEPFLLGDGNLALLEVMAESR